MRGPNSLIVLAASLAVAAGGCASRSADQPDEDITVIELPSRVSVTNNNQLDIRVFVFNNTQAIPLGTVSSFTSEVFSLPKAILARGQVRIMADPIGAVTAYVTDLISFGPGQVIEVIVQNNLQMSTYLLR